MWPEQAVRAQIPVEATRFEQLVIGVTGKTALMRTVSPAVFVSFKRWLTTQLARDALKRGRDQSQVKIVQNLMDEGLLRAAN